MLRRFIAPILTLVVILTVTLITSLNSEALAQTSEAERDYFLKPVPRANVVVVEPNYGRFYNPNPEIKGDASGEVLYSSLDELGQIYEIKGTKMVRFERKGEMIPNLYVYVDSIRMPESLAYGLPDS